MVVVRKELAMEELDLVVVGACVMWGIGMIGLGIIIYRQIASGGDDKY